MHPTWLALAAAIGLLSVAGGAFGAHALASRVTPDLLDVFQTGATYARFHVVGLLAVAVLAARAPSTTLLVAGCAFVLGVLLFTGSLWAMTLTGLRWLGAITPLGGLAFMVGWAALLVFALRR